MRSSVVILLAAVGVLWLASVFASAQATQPAAPPATAPAPAMAPATAPKAPRPDKAMAADTCATAECHASVKAYQVVHGPVNVNACDACHKLEDEKAHKYTLVREKAEMCTFCHTIDTKDAPVVHKPVTDGQCVQCHNPHGGATKALTRGKSSAEMCAACHKDPSADKKHIHGPVAAGGCDSCHTAHTGKHAKLLVATGRELCFTCHAEMKESLTKVKVQHKAVEQDCAGCHDAHASNHTMQIKQPPVDLCNSCHTKEKELVEKAAHKHSVVTKDQACLNCHTAHGGDLADLMKNEPIKVCMKCHEKPVEVNKQVVVAGVGEVNDPKLVKHGPIRDGNCSGCHNPHGSPSDKLLSKPYPAAFYQGFALEKYELCFSCHDKQLVLAEKAQGLTGFRNGQQNLHFVHVNKQEKGRSCRACHSTHASPNELHVRNSVPYGKWEMPINFKKSDTGGTCSPGCHKAYNYDRDKPVDYTTPAGPTTGPTARR